MSDTIACLCVTHRRLPLLKQAIQCFAQQTYSPRRLVIVHGKDDPETCAYLDTLRDERIQPVRVPSNKDVPLGELRNLSVRNAAAPLVAQWDDDDWHAPRRLELQAKALRKSRADACILQRWMVYDARSGKIFVSASRTWEASILAWRERLPAYPPLRRSEDTAVVDQLLQRDAVVFLDRPELYVYTFHGANTWHSQHWDRNIFAHATELDAEQAQFYRDRIAQDAIASVRAARPAGFVQKLRGLFKKSGRA